MNDLYIHQLETENKQLQERYERLKQEHIDTITRNEEKQQKIDKAIDYIKNNIDNTGWLEIGSSNVKELLEILGEKQWIVKTN